MQKRLKASRGALRISVPVGYVWRSATPGLASTPTCTVCKEGDLPLGLCPVPFAQLGLHTEYCYR